MFLCLMQLLEGDFDGIFNPAGSVDVFGTVFVHGGFLSEAACTRCLLAAAFYEETKNYASETLIYHQVMLSFNFQDSIRSAQVR